MSTKALLKHARSLQQKKFRDESGEFLVQGAKVVGELLTSGWGVSALLATEAMAARPEFSHAEVVSPHELDRVGTLESGNELIAVVRKPVRGPLSDLRDDELVIALDGITDPGNLGTVLRIADWFGFERVWCSVGSVDAYNPKCVQASMGAIFRVQVQQVDLPVVLARQQECGAVLYMASMEGSSVFAERLACKAVLVMGSESHGISTEVRALQGRSISIPGKGGSESLNVAMATSALCMEFARQRMR
ncbi:MAG: RNA methyltransferase [Flavobacteriales bacterium]|nr:RNA methyltransferase [Flavobacteriales bacterium]